MKKIELLKEYALCGLCGEDRQLNGELSDNLLNKLRRKIIEEIGDLDPYYNKANNMVYGQDTPSIVRWAQSIKTPSIAFGIYRLIQILKNNKIETFDDVKSRPESLIINEGKQLGAFNSSDEICFRIPENFNSLVNDKSCDAAGCYGMFIKNAVAIAIPYDDTFKGYNKSDNLDGIFDYEARIRGSIENPNIIAVSLPMTKHVGEGDRRPDSVSHRLGYRQGIVQLVRRLLQIYGYDKTRIVDSMGGYDLEDPDVIKAYNKVLLEYGFEGTTWSILSNNPIHNEDTLLNGLRKCEAIQKTSDDKKHEDEAR